MSIDVLDLYEGHWKAWNFLTHCNLRNDLVEHLWPLCLNLLQMCILLEFVWNVHYAWICYNYALVYNKTNFLLFWYLICYLCFAWICFRCSLCKVSFVWICSKCALRKIYSSSTNFLQSSLVPSLHKICTSLQPWRCALLVVYRSQYYFVIANHFATFCWKWSSYLLGSSQNHMCNIDMLCF